MAEASRASSKSSDGKEWFGILEAVVLAVVSVLTAWSGYQASRWEGNSADEYWLAAATTLQEQQQETLAGQEHLDDVVTFNGWLEAEGRGDKKLSGAFERRFRPEFRAAYAAWMTTNPFHDPKAPAGPSFMPEYRDARLAKARELAEQAKAHYQRGVASRRTGNDYVRIAVVLVTVVFLTALSRRFTIRRARLGLISVAFVLLVLNVFWMLALPRG